LPRDGPFQTVRELSMVRDVPRELFLGEDVNQNELLDPREDDGTDSLPVDNADGLLDAGWVGHLTAHSSVRELNASGQRRINLQTADERALTSIPEISAELARAIVAHRGQRQFESLAELLEVTAGNPQIPPSVTVPGAPVVEGTAAPVQVLSPAGPSGPVGDQGTPPPAGPRLVNEELLMEIADDLTVSGESALAGAVNINTASETVLGCLPGMSPELARAVVAHRKSAGFFPNIAWLLKVDGMDRELFKQLAPRVSARSETYRILSEGQVESTGVRKRLLVIVRVGSMSVETLAYREDNL
jgi:DNA uptake protein ComE-like DNA-binding protein